MPQDIKAFFHEWCSKNKVDPIFEIRPTGKKKAISNKNRENFYVKK